MPDAFLYGLLLFYLTINMWVSIFVGKRDELEVLQKTLQILLIWFVPFLGALVLWRLNFNHDITTKKGKDPDNSGGVIDSGFYTADKTNWTGDGFDSGGDGGGD